jgi:hypothetical protein
VADVPAPAPVVHRLPEAPGAGVHPGELEPVQRSVSAVAGFVAPAPGGMAGSVAAVRPPAGAGPAPHRGVQRPVPQATERSTGTPGGAVPVQTLVSLADIPDRPTISAPAAMVPADGSPDLPGDGRGVMPLTMPEQVAWSTGGAPTAAAGTDSAAAPRAAAAPGSAAAAGSAGDVDALVRRLYDPLARRLRAELRLDRERVGHALDLRH